MTFHHPIPAAHHETLDHAPTLEFVTWGEQTLPVLATKGGNYAPFEVQTPIGWFALGLDVHPA